MSLYQPEVVAFTAPTPRISIHRVYPVCLIFGLSAKIDKMSGHGMNRKRLGILYQSTRYLYFLADPTSVKGSTIFLHRIYAQTIWRTPDLRIQTLTAYIPG